MIHSRPPSGFDTDCQPDLPPPRFTLRGLGIAMGLLGATFAFMKWISPIASAGLLLLAASIFAHVAGNYIGTRLTGRQNVRTDWTPCPDKKNRSADKFAPRTQLGITTQIDHLGYAVTIVMALLGAIGGVMSGHLWSPQEIVVPPVFAVSLISGAALGGIGGFAIFHFAWQLFQSWRQAIEHSKSAIKRR